MNQNMEQVLEKVNKLPEVYGIAVRVAKMLNDEMTSANDLAKVISLDQALTIKLLRVCNSAYYGFSRKIVSVGDAISKLGFKTLKSLVFVAISHSVLNREVKGYDLQNGALWTNSISCAVYARYLAKISHYPDPETAFTAGLLRDLGKLIVHEYVGHNYSKILELVTTEHISFSKAEEQILGFNHTQIGSAAAKKWNFPNILVDAISYHHNPDEAINTDCEDIKLVYITHIADALTMMLGQGIGNDGMMYNLELGALEHIGIPQQLENIESLIAELVDLNSEIDSMAGIVNDGK